jgi:septum formation protein
MNRLTPANPLILASGSPRRIALLTEMGIPFEVHPSAVEEPNAGVCEQVALAAARLKAEEIASRFADRIVLGADTLVCLGEAILGKPADPGEARRMLRALRNRWHVVATGLCLIAPGSKLWTGLETTRVKMADFADEELEEYVATGEPLDKAGGYAIQGEAARFVERVDGDYFNVVGLPLGLLVRGLSGFVDTTGLVIPATPDRFA